MDSSADIAILVAEECEQKANLTAEKASDSAEVGWLMVFDIKEKKIESLMRKFEAKSQFAVAVSSGFFSA
ncbi:unnamed protein product [Arabidopsis arenosa]|uniref:Uncharacterized protein n=1 Tax=Arabidopsis arenosa TaxID=38785 RepID=A0A8S2AG85_ARAAE|nr:unnamed protein product [Arabidopsis arenosa]